MSSCNSSASGTTTTKPFALASAKALSLLMQSKSYLGSKSEGLNLVLSLASSGWYFLGQTVTGSSGFLKESTSDGSVPHILSKQGSQRPEMGYSFFPAGE